MLLNYVYLFTYLVVIIFAGSDVQRRIADAMAGMLKAGGRAMTGTDTTSSGGSAVGGGAAGDGYRAVGGQDSPTR